MQKSTTNTTRPPLLQQQPTPSKLPSAFLKLLTFFSLKPKPTEPKENTALLSAQKHK